MVPRKSLIIKEVIDMDKIALPMIVTGILLYLIPIISMFFHSTIGDDLELAGVSWAIVFSNITGYSILSGLAMGMEPICSQAFGAGKHTRLGLFLHKTILLLLFTSLPISLLWTNMEKILIFSGVDQEIATAAQTYLLYSLPDLLAQSFLHPIQIYLRSQSITLPITVCTFLSVVLHIPINYFLVTMLGLGIKGVAISSVWTKFNLVALLIIYILISGVYKRTWGGVSIECFSRSGWNTLLNLSIPTCISFCLDQWRYECMILLCGLLGNPIVSIASMRILIQAITFIHIFPSSLSSSVAIRVGSELGAGRLDKARLAAIVGLCCSVILGFSAMFFATGVRNLSAVAFTQDTEVMTMTSLVLPITGLCGFGDCLRTTGSGIFRGSARPRIVAYINLACFYLFGLPVAVVFGFCMGLGFEGLWVGVLMGQMFSVVLMSLVLGQWDSEAKKLADNGPFFYVDINDDIEQTYGTLI